MNITYLIGNGFDVNIGLKSSYADFYKSYVNNHPDNEPDVVTRFNLDASGGLIVFSKRFACKESCPKRLFLSLDVKIDSLQQNEKNNVILQS